MRRFDIQSIVAPLVVMLILTLLVGYTAYQVTANWEQAINKITVSLVRTQILNNVQWQLRQAHQAVQQNRVTEARELWRAARTQVNFMDRNANPMSSPVSLRVFMSNDQNIYKIPVILRQDYFKYNIEKLQNSLFELQLNSRRITLITTASMVVLGLLLISITALDLTRLFGELARSRDLNTKIQEEERNRIAQDLHDSVIQELIDLKRVYQPAKVDHLVDSIRRICHSLKPQVLEDLGLLAGLELLANDVRETSQCVVTLNVEEESLQNIPKSYELPLFRIVQELFNNIKRHSNATKASITLIYDPEESPFLRLYVRDNGAGFNTQQKSTGMGLTGVRERILQLEGRITIQSNPGKGSTFQMLIPIQKRRKIDV